MVLELITSVTAAQLLAGPVASIDAGALSSATEVDDVSMVSVGEILLVAWTDTRREAGFVWERSLPTARDIYLARVGDEQGAATLIQGRSRLLCRAGPGGRFRGTSVASDGGVALVAWRNEVAHPGVRLVTVDEAGEVRGSCATNLVAVGSGGVTTGPEVAVAKGRIKVAYATDAGISAFDVTLDGGALATQPIDLPSTSQRVRELSLAGTDTGTFVLAANADTGGPTLYKENGPAGWATFNDDFPYVARFVLAPAEDQALTVHQLPSGELKAAYSDTPFSTDPLNATSTVRPPLVTRTLDGYLVVGQTAAGAGSEVVSLGGPSASPVTPLALPPGAQGRALAVHATLGAQLAVVPDGGQGLLLVPVGSSFISSAVELTRHPVPQFEPSLAWVPDAGFLVAWQEGAPSTGRLAGVDADGLAPLVRPGSARPLLTIGSHPASGRLAALVGGVSPVAAPLVRGLLPTGSDDGSAAVETTAGADRLAVGALRTLAWGRRLSGLANTVPLVLAEGISSKVFYPSVRVNALGRCGVAAGGALWLPAWLEGGSLRLLRFDEGGPLAAALTELDTGLTQTPTGIEARPCAAAQADTLAITWSGASGVRVARYDLATERLLDTQALSIPGTGSADTYPVIAPLAGGWVVAWEAETAATPRIEATLVTPEGVVLPPTVVSVATEESRAPRLLGAPTGEAALAWTAFPEAEARVALRVRTLGLDAAAWPDAGGTGGDGGTGADGGASPDGGVEGPGLARFASCGCAAVDGLTVLSAAALLLLASSRRRRR